MTRERNISEIRKAIHFAIDAHDGQFRKFSGVEYVNHPIEVAKIVRENKTSKNIESILIAALCHDTVEDCKHKGITLEVIENNFGTLVSSMVNELTSDENEIKKLGKPQYLLNKMLNMTSYSLVIKLADRLHNCSDLGQSEKFTNKYVPETRFILNGLMSRTQLSNTHRNLISKIEDKISVYEIN